MDISIAIVTYNAQDHIEECLNSLVMQVPHGGKREILVIDGNSDDKTREIVKELFKDTVSLINNPNRTITSNRNVALSKATFPFIAFTDSDCTVPRDWLKKLADEFDIIKNEDPSIAGIGGGNIIGDTNNAFQTALGIALNTYIGTLGSVQGKSYSRRRRVGSLACLNVLYDRKVLISIDGFDEKLENMCEDADLNYRLYKNNYSLYYTPNNNVYHKTGNSIYSWSQKMFAYGKGRAKIVIKHHTLFSPSYIVVFTVLPTVLVGILTGHVRQVFLLVSIYILVVLIEGVIGSIRNKNNYLLKIACILAATHIFYIIGFWYELSISALPTRKKYI